MKKQFKKNDDDIQLINISNFFYQPGNKQDVTDAVDVYYASNNLLLNI